ncbi:MAG: class I SAM-dependent methyltransferase [Candidatus Poribacteria bacterium]|nr:class I SAM-dependent methyltransferase [Candidatus Poribacteria bacterium]
MSYIQCFNVNNYKPSESLKNLYEKLVIQPIENYLPSSVEGFRNIGSKKSIHHREVILEGGRTNFDESSEGFSPRDKVLLYCGYYLPMHLFSSYHIFSSKLSLPESNEVVFIDFGCGPLTSGIAFWAATRHSNITYIGIDKSTTMLKMAEEINLHGPYGTSGRVFFEDACFISDYNIELSELFDEIMVGTSVDTLIIFNFSHFLQSKTFEDLSNSDNNPSNIEMLGTQLEVLTSEYGDNKICVVYQDPPRAEYQDRWHNLKSWIIPYPSMFNVSGFGWEDPTKKTVLGYFNLWGISTRRTVSYDSFNNFFYLKNYSDL